MTVRQLPRPRPGRPAPACARDNRERVVMLLENNPYPQDVRVRSEAETLAAAGHAVTVIAPAAEGQPRREVCRGVEVVRIAVPDGSRRGAAGFLAEYLVAGVALHLQAVRALLAGATVLHIHNPPDIFFPAGALFRLARRKVIFDHHDLFPETVEVKLGSRIGHRFASICQRLTFAVAHRVIATNVSYAEVAHRNGKSPGAVTVVRNAPPAAWLELPTANRPGKLRTVELAYVGAVSSQDGLDGVAPILERLCTGPGALDVRLVVIGDGDGRPAVESALRARGVADRVTFTGWVAPERVPELAAAADICIDPTPGTDVNDRSTMTKLAEYLALGKPVVGFDLLEARRTAGNAALLVPRDDADAFADAVRRLANDPALRLRLAAAARRRARELSWDHSAAALLSVYAALRR